MSNNYLLCAALALSCASAQASNITFEQQNCSETFDSISSRFSQQGELNTLKLRRYFTLDAQKITADKWPQETDSNTFVLVDAIERLTTKRRPLMFRVVGKELHLTVNEVNGGKSIMRLYPSKNNQAVLETLVIDKDKHIVRLSEQILVCRPVIGH